MKLRTVIVLSVLLVGCVVYVAVQRLRPREEHQGEAFVAPVLGQTNAVVTAMRITDAAGQSVDLERLPTGWRVVAPYAARADRAAGDTIADALSRAMFVRVAADAAEVDSPAWRVQVTLDDGKQVDLAIGRSQASIGSGAVAATVRSSAHPDQVGVVELDFDKLFARDLADYCDPRLVVAQPNEVAAVEFEGREPFSLVQEEGVWRIRSSAFEDATDPQAVERFLRSLLLLFAVERHMGGDMASLGLTPETARLAVRLKCVSQRPIVEEETLLLIGNSTESGRRYAALAGSEVYFVIEGDMFESLQLSPHDLRDRKFMEFDPDAVTAVRIDLPNVDAPAQLVRQDGRWVMTSPLKGPGYDIAIDNLLATLNALEAAAFHDDMPLAGAGLESPRASITLSLADRDEPLVLSIGNNSPDGQGVFVACSDRELVLTIANLPARQITVGPTTYYTHDLFALPEGHEIQRIVVARPDDRTVTLLPEGRHWKIVGAETGRANDEAVMRLIEHLSDLQAVELVSVEDEVPSAYLDRRNTVLVTVTTAEAGQGPQKVHVIRMVKPRDGVGQTLGHFAFTPATTPAIVGRIRPEAYEAAMANFESRDIWTFDPNTIEEIRITQGAADPLVLTKRDDLWRIQEEPYARVNQSEVTMYLIRSKSLSASSYTDHGKDHLDVYGLLIPWLVVEFVDSEGTVYSAKVSRIGPMGDQSPRYAITPEVDVIYLMDGNTIARLAAGREDFLSD